jgi:hypothetical protein
MRLVAIGLSAILGLAVVGPRVAAACEGPLLETGEEKPVEIKFNKVLGEEKIALVKNATNEEVDIGKLALAGPDAALFKIEEVANCENKTLEKKGNLFDECSVKVRLENIAAKEAELQFPAEGLPSKRKEVFVFRLVN